MCYSKEVQLITSLILLSSALFYYLYYSRKYRRSEKLWLVPFVKTSMLVFLSIGLHQFFEFLSLLTDNLLVYKIGLIISLCAVYFLLRSLEVLSNNNLHSKIALIPIALVSLQILFSPMNFTQANFYLHHNSAFFWAATWLLLFIYWHICAFKIYAEIKDDHSKKTVLVYLLGMADLSFVLSVMYVLIGHLFFSVNVCTSAPSIWCTFYVVQSFLIPLLVFRLDSAFKRTNKPKEFSIKQVILFVMISLLILTALIITLPLFNCLTWKFVFP